MLKKLKTPKELAELEAESTGGPDWLSMWASIIVPLTVLALGAFAIEHSDITKEMRHDKYVADSVEAAATKHYDDSVDAWGVRFMDSLGRARAAAGWCDIDHRECPPR